MYKKPNLVETFIEVNLKDQEGFVEALNNAAGNDGASVTGISKKLLSDNNTGDFSKFFMTLTGSADSGNGKPNASQLTILRDFSALNYGSDREAWDISQRVSNDISNGRPPRTTDSLLPSFASPAFD